MEIHEVYNNALNGKTETWIENYMANSSQVDYSLCVSDKEYFYSCSK